jgi:hypothetical protein
VRGPQEADLDFDADPVVYAQVSSNEAVKTLAKQMSAMVIPI